MQLRTTWEKERNSSSINSFWSYWWTLQKYREKDQRGRKNWEWAERRREKGSWGEEGSLWGCSKEGKRWVSERRWEGSASSSWGEEVSTAITATKEIKSGISWY